MAGRRPPGGRGAAGRAALLALGLAAGAGPLPPGRRLRAYLRAAAVGVGVALAAVGLVPLLLFAGTPDAGSVAPEILDIPAPFLAAYLEAASRSAGVVPGCSLPWTVLAAVGRVESDHGRAGGAPSAVGPGGETAARIVGPPLDGSGGTRAVPDTDAGAWDGDATWDRAVGPMQFLPSTWRAAGLDGSGDGVADPHDVRDAALSAAAHLCRASGGDLAGEAGLSAALLAYNPSEEYVRQVTEWVRWYAAVAGPRAEADWVLPFPRGVTEEVGRPHHDGTAAVDVPLPAGTTLLAATEGTVSAVHRDCPDPEACRCGNGLTLAGLDGFRYLYCHAESVGVVPGAAVAAGQPVGLSGWTGNVVPLSPAGAHLHFEVDGPGGPVCPQALLRAWAAGVPLSPAAAPAGPCAA